MSDLSGLPRAGGGSRTEIVTRALRDAITEGTILPGERLLETHLAKQMGTSNGPIREALRQLEAEGLVVSAPYRGTFVAEVSQEEIEQVLVPVRLMIEQFAFRKARPLLTQGDIGSLQRFVDEMRAAADTDDPDRLAEADVQFHRLVLERSQQDQCLHLWNAIQPRVRAYFRRDAPAHHNRYEVADQHQVLLAALCSGDEDEMLKLLDEHIHTFLDPTGQGVRR